MDALSPGKAAPIVAAASAAGWLAAWVNSTRGWRLPALPAPLVVRALPALPEPDYCNDAAALDSAADKIVWHVRHGESEGNVAKHAAMAADERSGTPL